MASLATREAAQARDQAADKWRSHRKNCVTCERAARARRPREMCPAGRAINSDYRDAMADHLREKVADNQDNPDQGELFPELPPKLSIVRP